MHLSELLGREVVTAAGEHVGTVHDVRLVQDGPMLGTWGAAFRVDALVVGRGWLAARLGVLRADGHTHWLFRLIERRASPETIPWDDVIELADVVTVRRGSG